MEHAEYPVGLDFLRTSLIHRGDDFHHRIIGISAAQAPRPFPNFTANLAILLALAGRRTLVIDLHFEAPQQDKLLGIRCTEGLAEWLASGRPLRTFIHQGDESHLGIISTGTVAGDTEHLYSQHLLQNELEPLLEDWDFILLDAPPLLQNWTLSLALPARQSLILTADYGDTTFENLEKTAAMARDNDWNVLGVVLQRCPKAICPSGIVVVEEVEVESGDAPETAHLRNGYNQRDQGSHQPGHQPGG